MTSFAPSPMPSHQIHSIFGQFAAMSSGQLHNAPRSHGAFLFTPPVRVVSPPTSSGGSRGRSKSSRSSNDPTQASKQTSKQTSTPKRPSVRRSGSTSPPSPSSPPPPPPYSAAPAVQPFINPDAKEPIRVISLPSYCDAAPEPMPAAVVLELAKRERERRARVLASILLIRSQRSVKPLRRTVSDEPLAPAPAAYTPSGLSSAMTAATDGEA